MYSRHILMFLTYTYFSRSPESRISSGSNRSANRNGAVREVYATIHDHDDRDVITSLIDRTGIHNVIDRQHSAPIFDRPSDTAITDRTSFVTSPIDRQTSLPMTDRHFILEKQTSSSPLIINNKTNGKSDVINSTNSDVDL